MNTAKENSKAAFNQQAATYDKDIKGQHARSLYPVLLEKLSHIPFQSALDLGCGTPFAHLHIIAYCRRTGKFRHSFS